VRPVAATAILFSALAAAAQSPMPYERPADDAPPAASTETVSASSSTANAPSDEAAGRGFKVAGDEPKAKIVRPLHAVIHKGAADWEPLSLRVGGVPGAAGNDVALKVVKIKGRMKGENSKARSVARLHKGVRDSRWLVISSYPKSLYDSRTHFELRFRVFEGFVEGVEAAAVTVTDRSRRPSSRYLDAYGLRAEGIEYQEDRPGSGQFVVAEFDPRPGASSVNSGRLEKAQFAKKIGFVNLSWSVKGVRAARK